jgi:proteasome lid subunit RPN8/RPN11
MTNSYFSYVEEWRIPETAISDSLAELAVDGEHGNEGIVLWLGRDESEVAEVTHLVRLRGPLVEKCPDLINIHPSLLNDVADVAMDHKARLIGQVHSHGPGYRLDLSPTDRDYGIKAPYYLSLVAPDYGMTNASIHLWGVHVYFEADGYLRLTPQEVHRRINVVRGPGLPFLTVGAAK